MWGTPGRLRYHIRTTMNFDVTYLRQVVDEDIKSEIMFETFDADWTEIDVIIGPGSHNVSWTFAYLASLGTIIDPGAAYIDDVSFIPDYPVTPKPTPKNEQFPSTMPPTSKRPTSKPVTTGNPTYPPLDCIPSPANDGSCVPAPGSTYDCSPANFCEVKYINGKVCVCMPRQLLRG